MATSVVMTGASKKANPEAIERSELQQLLCLYYLAQFSEFYIEAFINSGGEINVIQPCFLRKVGLYICETDVGT